MALPRWLDEGGNTGYEAEKALLEDLHAWGQELGWLPITEASSEDWAGPQADLILSKADQNLLFEVVQKGRTSDGYVKVRAVPTFRDAALVWIGKKERWTIELGGVPLDREWNSETFAWLVGRLFAK